jgi:hypothetical protein
MFLLNIFFKFQLYTKEKILIFVYRFLELINNIYCIKKLDNIKCKDLQFYVY